MAYASAGVALVVALAALGLSGHSLPALGMQLRSGQAWLSNLANGSVSFIDGYSGEVVGQVAVADATSKVVNTPYGAVVVGSDGRLIQVSNANFTTSPSVELLGGGSLTAAAGGSALYAINTASGQIQQLNPAEPNLPPIGAPVSVSAPIVTPVVAPDGSLYFGVPKTGAVGHVRDGLLNVIDGVAGRGHRMAVVVAGSQPVGADLTAGVVRPLGTAAVAGPAVRLPASALPIRQLTGSDSVNGLVSAVAADSVESADVTTGALSSTSIPSGFTPTDAVMQGRNVVLIDSARRDVLFVNTASHVTRMLAMPGDQPPSQLTVQDGLVFVNASDGPSAMVINGAGQWRPVTKYTSPPPSQPKPATLPSATPSTSSSVTPRTGQKRSGPPTRPSAPTNPVAQPSNASATVSWGPPANGGQVADYVLAWSGGSTGTETVTGALDATVSGLTNGSAYTFTIRAQNSVGTGPPATTTPVTPSSADPAQPTGLRATATQANGSVSLTWTEPAGGAPAQSYTFTEVAGAAGGASVAPASVAMTGGTSATISGVVTPATTAFGPVTFTVTAVDAGGVAGPASGPSNQVTPFLAPALTSDDISAISYAPAGTTATLTVTCDAVCQQGDPIQSYTVTGNGIAQVTQAAASGGDAPTTINLTGLTPNTQYNAQVIATDDDNAAGAVLVVQLATQGPPVVTSVTVSQATAAVGAAPAVDVAVTVNPGGEALTACTYSISVGGSTQTGISCATGGPTQITVPTYNTAYTATVTATNQGGSSAAYASPSGTSSLKGLTANASTAFGAGCPNYYGSNNNCGPTSTIFQAANLGTQVTSVAGNTPVTASCWETGQGISGTDPGNGYPSGTDFSDWVEVTSPAGGFMSELYFPDPPTVTSGLPQCP